MCTLEGWKMKRILIALLACPMLSPAAFADAVQACTDIYKNATHDFSQVDITNTELARSFDSFCESDGSVSTKATGIGLEAVVKSIPFKFSFSSTSDDQKLTEFCKVGKTQHDTWNSSHTISSTVVAAALSNFNSCIQLANSGLQLAVAINPPASLVVSGSPSNGYAGFLSSIAYDETEMTCVSADFGNGKSQKYHGPVHLSAAKSFALTCTKTKSVSKDGQSTYFPRTNLTIAATGVSPLAIVFPSDTLNGYELASQAQASVAQAATAYTKANADLIAEHKTSETLRQRLGGVSSTIVVHSFGSGFPWGCGPSNGDWGGDIQKEAAAACGANKYTVASSEVRSGGHCGYGVIGYACTIVPP
jgi:opacity protein-like surface antigen